MEKKEENSFDEQVIKQFGFGNHDYLDGLWERLFLPGDYVQFKKIIEKIQLPRGVCGRTFTKKDIGWFCKDCQVDANAVMCQECFELSNHVGHRLYLNRSVGGCCDCGDPDSLRAEGFCVRHRGFVDEEQARVDLLPAEYRGSIPAIISLLVLRLYSVCKVLLETQNRPEDSNDESGSGGELDEKCFEEVQAIINMLRQISEVTPIFLYVVCKEMAKRQTHYYHKGSGAFRSPKRINIDNEKEQSTLVDVLIATHGLFPKTLRQKVVEFLTFHIQSRNFKSYLASAYLRNLSTIYGHVKRGGGKFTDLGVQVLSMEGTVSELLRQSPEVSGNILNCIKMTVSAAGGASFSDEENSDDDNSDGEEDAYMSGDSHTNSAYDKLELIVKDLSYAMRQKTVLSLIQSGFFEKYFEILCSATCNHTFQMLTTHLEEDPVYIEAVYDAECHLIKIFKMVASGVDYTDHTFCKGVAMGFKKALLQSSEKALALKDSYFTIPVHRCFAIFVVTYIHAFFMLGKGEKADPVVVRGLLKETLDIASDSEYDAFVKKVLVPALKCLGYFQEVAAKKWIYYGDIVDDANMHYVSELGYYDAILLLTLATTLSDAHDFGTFLLNSFTQGDKWLPNYLSVITDTRKLGPDEVAIELAQRDVDLDKSKRILENALYLLCGLCTHDTLLLPFVWQSIRGKRYKLPYKEEMEKLMRPYRKLAIKKVLVQVYFQKKKLWMSFSKLKELVPRVYAKNDGELIDCLSEIAERTKDKTTGQDMYCMRNSCLKSYNPFYYIFTGKNAGGYEKCDEFYKKIHDPAAFNPLFGPKTSEPANPIDFTIPFQRLLARSDLTDWIVKILGANRESTSDPQILYSLKLLQVMRPAQEEMKMEEKLKAAIENGVKNVQPGVQQYADILHEYTSSRKRAPSLLTSIRRRCMRRRARCRRSR